MKFKSLTLLLLCLFVISIFTLGACKDNSTTTTNSTTEKYKVNFYIDGNLVGNQSVDKTMEANYVIRPNFGDLEKTNDIFDGWYIDRLFSQKFNFSENITSDLSLYARNLTYYEALTVIVNNKGVDVTSSEIGLDGTDGKAIKITGGTGDNRCDAYLELRNNYLGVVELNKNNTNFYYMLLWRLDTGNGSYYVCNSSMMVYFSVSFSKKYEASLSISESNFSNIINTNWGYSTNTGLTGAKNSIINISRSIDSLIYSYYY